MRYFAKKLGYGEEADFWAMAGLLHDIDFEMYPDEHCINSSLTPASSNSSGALIQCSSGYISKSDVYKRQP